MSFSVVYRRRLSFIGWIFALLFLASTLLGVAAQVLSIGGIPVRTIVTVGSLGFLAVVDVKNFVHAFRASKKVLLLLVGFAILGSVIDAANGTPLSKIINQVVEIHVQSGICYLLAIMVTRRIGPKRAACILVSAVGISALVAIGQFVGMSWAWEVKAAMAQLTGVDLYSDYYYRTNRPMGLSFTPVTLGSQACVALAAYLIATNADTDDRIKWKRTVMLASPLMIALMTASGNRSPILGVLIFLIIYVCIIYRRYTLVLIAGALLVIPVFQLTVDSLSSSGLRITEMSDESSSGRITLSYYGLLLFLSQPAGYGLNFDPTQLWQPYWEDIQWTPYPYHVRIFPLHNYPLTILNMYGAMCLLFAPTIWRIARNNRWATLMFAPYFIDLLFHNGGPLWYDYFVWFGFGIARVVGALRYEAQPKSVNTSSPAAPAPRYRLPA